MKYISVSEKNWIFKKYNSTQVKKISEKFFLKEITSRLLAIRDVKIEDISLFLNPTIKNAMPNPYQILDMENAVSRISDAILNHETLGIFGDYDVDGAASTALLVKYFKSIKHNTKSYIPDRKKDGYGPSIVGFKKLIKDHCKAIITVDCGTSSFDPIDYAKNLGIDVIVLDHHQSEINLPKAHSIVNPNRLDDNSNLKYLCATGVTFMFLVALNIKLRKIDWFNKNQIQEPNMLNFLDLVCLGTICDVVPLTGLNRAIVNQGLKIIKKRSNLGIKTLYDLCNIKSKPTAYHVGYLLGPRINAGGRVGKSEYGAELLSSNNSEMAYKIANALDNYNKQRQEIEKELLIKVDNEANKYKQEPILVLSGNNWHEGIIGIIASRIKDKYNKPVFIISLNGGEGKGSARSIIGFDIGSAIISAVQSGILKKGGGHKMAGGFSIEKGRIDDLKNFLTKKFHKIDSRYKESKNLYLDAVLSSTALNEDFFEDINLLSPFGPGNSEPTFVLENIKIVNSSVIADKHIKIIMYSNSGTTIKGIAFNSRGGILENYLLKKNLKPLHIAGKLTMNEWQGKKDVEFVIQDIAIN